MIKIYFNNRIKRCFLKQVMVDAIVKRAALILKLNNIELELNIVGDGVIRQLNQIYRGTNKPTDVLAFAWQDERKVDTNFLGQIYICYPQIVRQSKHYQINEIIELKRMVIHGLLHLLGYNHHQPKQAKIMFGWQEKIINHELQISKS